MSGVEQLRIKALLEKAEIPYTRIEVYGGHIVVTCGGRATAEEWAAFIGKFAKVRKVGPGVDYVGPVRKDNARKVWRCWAVI